MGEASNWTIARAFAPGLLVFITHAILGNYLGHEPIVDPIAHFLGGSAVAYCAVALIPQFLEVFGRPSRIAVALLSVGLGTITALAWELGELTSDLLFGTTIQVDARNTLRDLALGFSGTVVTTIVCWSRMRTNTLQK